MTKFRVPPGQLPRTAVDLLLKTCAYLSGYNATPIPSPYDAPPIPPLVDLQQRSPRRPGPPVSVPSTKILRGRGRFDGEHMFKGGGDERSPFAVESIEGDDAEVRRCSHQPLLALWKNKRDVHGNIIRHSNKGRSVLLPI